MFWTLHIPSYSTSCSYAIDMSLDTKVKDSINCRRRIADTTRIDNYEHTTQPIRNHGIDTQQVHSMSSNVKSEHYKYKIIFGRIHFIAQLCIIRKGDVTLHRIQNTLPEQHSEPWLTNRRIIKRCTANCQAFHTGPSTHATLRTEALQNNADLKIATLLEDAISICYLQQCPQSRS